MRLRPHHLLCTQGYSGKGYDIAFIKNMNQVVARLRGTIPVEIELVFDTDDLCCACPYKLQENLCETQGKVQRFDQKVVEYFQLEEKKYIYQDLIREIDEKMTEEMLSDICQGCSWYPVSACRKNICKNHIR